MRQIPPELLQNIFCQTLQPIDCHDGDYPMRHADAYILANLSLVCREWKDLVESTPAMWTYIMIDEDSTLETTSRYLERAKNCPLHIYITFWDETVYDKGDTFDDEIEAIVAKADQWASFRLHGGVLNGANLDTVIPKSLPRLVDAAIESSLEDRRFKPFHSAPNLLRLTIKGDYNKPFLFCDSVGLRHFRMEPFCGLNWETRWDDLFAHLSTECPELEVLEIERGDFARAIMDREVGEPRQAKLAILRSLKELSIGGCCPHTLRHILHRLDAPHLEVLRLPNISEGMNLNAPINLPVCKTISFTKAPMSAVQSFMSKISNAPDLLIQIDFIDAYILSMRAERSADPEGGPASQLPASPISMLPPFAQLCGTTKVELVIAPLMVTSATQGLAGLGDAVNGISTWMAWVANAITDCSSTCLQIFSSLEVTAAEGVFRYRKTTYPRRKRSVRQIQGTGERYEIRDTGHVTGYGLAPIVVFSY